MRSASQGRPATDNLGNPGAEPRHCVAPIVPISRIEFLSLQLTDEPSIFPPRWLKQQSTRNPKYKFLAAQKIMARFRTWVADHHLQGWACSECEWKYPLPALLSDPAAKSAYDRLAGAKFEEHDCADNPKQLVFADGQTFAERARKLVMRGFKPKDAVELTLQEIGLEHRGEPKTMERARVDAEDFLRRVRQGLI